MELIAVARELNLDGQANFSEAEWQRSQASQPEGDLFFLTPPFITHAFAEARIPGHILAAALVAAKQLAASPAARALAWHLHCCLYRAEERQHPYHVVRGWPSLDEALPETGRMLYLLVLLSGLPDLERINHAHAVPEEVSRETLSDINRWFGGGEDAPPHPPWGITPNAVGWLTNHLRGDLYRLGRLQFQFGSFHQQVRVFRNRRSHAVLALTEEGVNYREDGGSVTEDVESGTAWISRLLVTGGQVTGNPISPGGRALPEEVTLATADWEQVLAPGQPALHLHIPTGGPLDHAQCGESLRRAREFFPRHFPDRPFTTFCCGSWLLDAELQQFLPDTSNIVRFQREFYLLPAPITPGYMHGSLFNRVTFSGRETSLQRTVRAWLDKGNVFRPLGGACFLLPEDLHWGAQVYLSR